MIDQPKVEPLQPVAERHEFSPLGDPSFKHATFAVRCCRQINDRFCGQPRQALVHQVEPVASQAPEPRVFCDNEEHPDPETVKDRAAEFLASQASVETDPPELLLCPFCGGQAALTNVRMSNHTFRVGCYNENCGVRPATDYFGSREQPATARQVIKAWNTRADLASRPAIEAKAFRLAATTPALSEARDLTLRAICRQMLNHSDDAIRPRGAASEIPRECPCCEAAENAEGIVSHYLSCHFQQIRELTDDKIATPDTALPAERCDITCHDPSYNSRCLEPHRCVRVKGHDDDTAPRHVSGDFEGHSDCAVMIPANLPSWLNEAQRLYGEYQKGKHRSNFWTARDAFEKWTACVNLHWPKLIELAKKGLKSNGN